MGKSSGPFGEMILTSVFPASKFWAEVPLHGAGFQHFLSVLTVSKRRDPDPGTKVGIRRQSAFSQFWKIGQGFPCTRQFSQICSVFFSTISKRESGSKRDFSTSVFSQLKNRAGVPLHTAGFSNFSVVFLAISKRESRSSRNFSTSVFS